MTIRGASAPPSASRGRERTCVQCGAPYRSPRNSSLYCSAACRKRAQRGSSTAVGPTLDLLQQWLLRRTYAGKIGPVNRRDPRRAVYALTVPRALASSEWNAWNPGAAMTEEAFARALARLGIHGPDYLGPRRGS